MWIPKNIQKTKAIKFYEYSTSKISGSNKMEDVLDIEDDLFLADKRRTTRNYITSYIVMRQPTHKNIC